MRLNDLTRPTRWGHPPPPPGPRPPARQVLILVWAPCTDCDVQVHGRAALLGEQGLSCPECNATLIPAGLAEPAPAAIAEQERAFTREATADC